MLFFLLLLKSLFAPQSNHGASLQHTTGVILFTSSPPSLQMMSEWGTISVWTQCLAGRCHGCQFIYNYNKF